MGVSKVGSQAGASSTQSARNEASKWLKSQVLSSMVQSLTKVNVSAGLQESAASRRARAQK